MQILKYNLIQGPKKTVSDYLQSLNNDELQNMLSASLLYGVKMPDLFKKMQGELQKRNVDTQLMLF